MPSRAIGSLIGIPSERREAFVEWTEALVSADPHKKNTGDLFPAIYGEFEKLLAERRAEPRDDLMSALVAAEIDGQHLTQEELLVRMPRYELEGEPRWYVSPWARALQEVPVRDAA